MARTELPNGVILPAEYSDDWYEDMTSNLTKLDDVIGSDSEKLNADGVYFLRMSSAALTDSGTGNFSDLNSSYKIKTGDLVLDSGRKLYRIVSVDSANETFTVGNSLFKVTAESDLATVATSGDYDDLSNKPFIPTKTSDLTNDSNFVDNTDPAVASGITSAKVTDYDTHLTNTDIHVTAADKQKWNDNVNQSYVLRYASTSVTPSSTIAYSVLNNTDNIKAGDSVIDSAGQVFLIASVDSANQTVTVSAVLLTLALDANVMHLSGNESASGDKNFRGLLTTIPSSSLWPAVSNTSDDITLLGRSVVHLERLSSGRLTDLSGSAWNVVELGEGCFFFRTNNGTDIRFKHFPTNLVNRIYVVNGANRHINNLIPDQDNTRDVGSNSLRWATFNGINPGALSLPDLNNGLDISGFINTGDSDNHYTPLVDGYISVRIGGTNSCALYASQGDVYISSYGNIVDVDLGGFICSLLIPVVKNVACRIVCRRAQNIVSAKFFPCLGNV